MKSKTGRHRLKKRLKHSEVSRKGKAEKKQENKEINAEMENHKEQRDTGAHRAGKKREKMAQERQ